MLSRLTMTLRTKAITNSNVFLTNVILSRHLYSGCIKNKQFYAINTPRILRYSSDDRSFKCWKCLFHHGGKLFCSRCNSLQEIPVNFTYFDIINIDQNYDVSIKELQDKYRQLQSILHPDKFVNKSEKEKQISQKLSSFVNKAYSTLLNPMKRGLYMLHLNDVSIPEGNTDVNPEFLLEIMEKNELIEQASQDKEKIIQLLFQNKAVLDSLKRQVSEAFQVKDYEKAKEILIKMKYYTSIESRLKRIKQDLGISD